MHEIEDVITEDFAPFFSKMINEMVKHYPEKGDSWKIMSELGLGILLKKSILEFDNKMISIEHLVDVANFCAMVYLRRKSEINGKGK